MPVTAVIAKLIWLSCHEMIILSRSLSHNQLPLDGNSLHPPRPTTMTKSRAERASKYTPQTIQNIKEMVAQGLSREEIAHRLDVTVGSLQVTCSKLGVSLRRSRTRFPYKLLKPEFELSQAGSEVDPVESSSLLKVK